MTVTSEQIRALALLTVGYASEVKNKSSLVLSWAMTYKNGLPANNSGYSVGNLQSDLGQRPELVPGLVTAYYAWAGSDASRLMGRTANQLNSVLKQQGRKGLVPNADSDDLGLRPLSADEQAKFNQFLQTTEGRQAVWAMDLLQIAKQVAFAERVTASQTYQSFVDDSDKNFVLTAAMKLFNQSEYWAKTREVKAGDNLAHLMESSLMSWSDIRDFITVNVGAKADYIKTGFEHAMPGVALYNKVLTSNTPLSVWLTDLGGQNLTGLGQSGFASDPRFQVLERLFRDPAAGSKFVDSLAQSKSALMLLPKELEGQAKIIGIDKTGQMFSAESDGKGFKRFVASQWSDSSGNYNQSDSPILKRNTTGRWVLALGTEEIVLGNEGSALAQVNINGFDVTLDANKGGQYLFLDDGVLVRASYSQNLSVAAGEILTGEYAGCTVAFQDRNLGASGGGMRTVSFNANATGSGTADYLAVINDGNGRVTTIDVKPIRQNTDTGTVIIGSECSVSVALGGVTQSLIATSDSVDPFTGQRTQSSDAKTFDASTGAFASHTYTSATSTSAGLPLSNLEVTYNALGQVTQTRLTELQPNGSQTTVTRDGQGATLSTTNVQVFDDGSSLKATTTANGATVTESYDTDQTLAGTITSTPDGTGGFNRVVATTVAGKAVELQQHANAAALADGEQTGDYATSHILLDGIDAAYQDLAASSIDAAGNGLNFITARNSGAATQLVTAINPASPTGSAPAPGATPAADPTAWYNTPEALGFGRTLTEVQSLVAAFKGGKPGPIAINFFNLAASAAGASSGIGIGTSALNAVNELSNFFKAFERGDELAAAAAGAAFARSALLGMQGLVQRQIENQFGTLAAAEQAAERAGDAVAIELTSQYNNLGQLAGSIGQALPYLNLLLAIKSGDELSIVGATAAVLNSLGYTWAGPIGWAIAAYQIFNLIFNEPEIYAEAKYTGSSDGITVAPLLLREGDAGGEQTLGAMGSLLTGLQTFLSTHFPGDDRVLIAQRLPWLRFDGVDSGQGVFTMRWRDSATGVVQARRFDVDGVYIGAGEGNSALLVNPATDENFFRSMGQQFVEIALGDYQGQSALGPRWAAQTAYAQAHRGTEVPVMGWEYDVNGNPVREVVTGYVHQGTPVDPYAGFTTLQRAKEQGQLLAFNPGDAKPGNAGGLNASSTQTAQLITIDLDGNGIQTTLRAEGGSVLVDIDDDGFAEAMDWLSPREGILVLDANGDGRVSGGHEMFNDSPVNMAARGLHVLDELDGDGDMLLNASDPAFAHLRVWQDINHDGQVQEFELSSFAQRGISQININAGQVVMNGVAQPLHTTALVADSAGFMSNALGNSVMVLAEATGQNTLLASALGDYAQSNTASGVLAHRHASGDGVLVAVDELMDGLEDTTLTVSTAQLLANDASAGGSALSVAGVSGAVGGLAVFDAAAQVVRFTPAADFNGTASFNYTVQDATGRSAVATAVVEVVAVNDAPVVTRSAVYRDAQWGDMVEVATQQEFGVSRAYSLPAGAQMGAAVTDTTGIVPFNWTAGNANLIGFRGGYMFASAWVPYTGPGGGPPMLGWQPVALPEANAGKLTVTDVDSPASAISLAVLKGPDAKFGTPVVDAQTGIWHYSHSDSSGQDDAFVIRADDGSGGTTEIKVVIDVGEPLPDLVSNGESDEADAIGGGDEADEGDGMPESYGETDEADEASGSDEAGSDEAGSDEAGSDEAGADESGTGDSAAPPLVEPGLPVVLDLNGNGFHFIPTRDSNAYYDFTGDGVRERTGWTSGADGILAYDLNGDGVINKRDEIRFKGYTVGARTDLEGLAHFDTNVDGTLSAADAEWSKFYVWQDANEDGLQTPTELRTLAQAGVQSLNLTTDNVESVVDGATVFGIGAYTRIDGSSAKLADVRFTVSSEVQQAEPANEIIADPAGGSINSGSGADRIHGGAGVDQIFAGPGADRVAAGAGNDLVLGDAGNDILAGEAGDDQLAGGRGDDSLSGGMGNDLLHGDAGDDRLYGDTGDDHIYGDAGNDVLAGGDGNDLLYGGDGLDKLFGGAGHDTLFGGVGADQMQGDAGNDVYVVGNVFDTVFEAAGGGDDTVISLVDQRYVHNVETFIMDGADDIEVLANASANSIFGNKGSNYIDGGAGAELMAGGAGDDVYVVDNLGDLVVERADGQAMSGAEAALIGANNVLNAAGFNTYGHVGFTGTAWGTDAVKAFVTYTLPQNVENLILTGSAAINGTGNAQVNLITGNAAANTLAGGAGDDVLQGGGGADRYRYAHGDGQDRIVDTQGADVLEFGANINRDDLRFSKTGTDLVVSVLARAGYAAGSVTLAGWFVASERVNSIAFSAGTAMVLDVAALNHAPLALADAVTMTEDQSQISGNALANDSDPDAGDTLTVANAGNLAGSYGTLILGADGSYAYDLNEQSTAVQSLAPGERLSDAFSVTVRDSGLGLLTTPSTLTFTINGVNDAPLVAIALPDATAVVMSPFVLDLPVAMFTDFDHGESLTWNVALASGGAWPAWLTYDPAMRRFSGTPARSLSGSIYDFAVSATDTYGATVSDVFRLTVSSTGVLLNGTAGIDTLVGTYLDDTLDGQAGNDTLQGADGDDTLIGGPGADTLIGGLGNDTYVVDSTSDVLTEAVAEGIDTVQSPVTWTLGNNLENLTLTGSAGVNATGNTLANVLTGNAGVNILSGGAGDDTLDGGAGNDTLNGGTGNNLFKFGRGSGQDFIKDVLDTTANKASTLLFGANVAPSDVSIRQVYTAYWGWTADLEFGIKGTTDKISVSGMWRGASGFGGEYTPVQLVKFADGTTWTSATLISLVLATTPGDDNITGSANADVLMGGLGNDTLDGSNGDDRLGGGPGNDTLAGGIGNNTYVFNRGDGQDLITNFKDTTLGKANVLEFGAGIAPADVTARQVYDSYWGTSAAIEFSINGTTDKITVGGMWRTAGGNGEEYGVVQLVRFSDGTTWNYATFVPALMATTTGDDLITGTINADTIDGGAGNDNLNGGKGNDTLIGGPGNDTLTGETGNNTYVFNRGDGQDLITNFTDTTVSKNSVLQFGANIAPGDVVARQVYDSTFGMNAAIEFSIVGTADKVTVGGMWRAAGGFGNEVGVVQTVRFADGTTWNYSTFVPALMAGTAGDDTIVGTINGDTINGGDGNDAIAGMTGNDTIAGGAGDDSLYGNEGNDTLDGGAGNDGLAGGTGNNTYMFGRGDGQDVITYLVDTTATKVNTLRFKNGVSPADIRLTQTYDEVNFNDYYNLQLTIADSSDSVTIVSFWREFDTPGNHAASTVQRFEFSNGTVWNRDDVKALVLGGTPGNDRIFGTTTSDTITGTAGDDTLIGRAGNDLLIGGDGYDTAWVPAGSYAITRVADNTYTVSRNGETDTLQSVEQLYLTIKWPWYYSLADSYALTSGGVVINDTTPEIGQTLSMISTLGNNTITLTARQWQVQDGATWSDIAGATSTTFTPSLAQAGKSLRALLTFSDRYGAGQVATSPATAPIPRINNLPTGTISIAGTAAEDQTLSAVTSSLADADGLGAFSYQWLRGGVVVAGATGATYSLAGADVGQTIQVRVTYVDGGGTPEILTSAATPPVSNVNDAPQGLPLIAGTATEDSMLTVSATPVSDEDGLGTFSVTWLRNGAAIAGATGVSYTPSDADVGATLQARLSYVDGYGTAETVTSLASAPVANVNDLPSGLPAIVGTATERLTLTVSTAAMADADGLGPVNYQWQRNGAAIPGATSSSYSLGDADVGAQLRVQVSYTDGHGTPETLISAATAPVANVNDAPTGAPTIAGSAVEDQVLSANTSSIADADGLGSFSYQWQRNGIDVAGATLATLALGDADAGKQMRVRVSYTDAWGTNEVLTSAATLSVANVNDAPVGMPSISGTATVGQTLGAVTTAVSDADGLGTFAYQWKRSGVAVAGATAASYLLTNADVGAQMSLSVTYTDGFGTAETLASAPTPTVQIFNHLPTGSVTVSGTAALGQTLTATSTVADVDGLGTLTWRWQALNGALWSEVADNNRNTLIVDARFTGLPLRAGVSYTDAQGTTEAVFSGATSSVASVTFNAIIGTAGADTLSGTAGADKISGLAGNDTLNGGIGNDLMLGGLGDDTYVVDALADGVVENPSEGNDTVQSSVTYTLPAEVENMTLTGTAAINATGNSQDNLLTGNSAANVLQGAAGNDTLNGGTGADTLAGGTGNDTYVVDNVADAVNENAGEGTDLVQASVTFTLSNNLENLSLTGTAAINGTGNSLNNNLLGNSGNNVLTGWAGNDMLDGAAGNDTLVGGAGDDIYFVDATKDVVTELAGEGTDTANSAVTYTLPANVENLNLTGSLSNNGTGNTLDNIIVGNAAANTLTGDAGNDTLDGGAGADKLVGGLGNDTYIVDLATDITTEAANEGTDTVMASVTLTLSINVENLTLTGLLPLNGTGNAAANVLLGNAAANVLTGAAGNDTLDGAAGNDTLVGGTGADIYAFGRGSGVDTVQENDATTGVLDRVQFGANIAQADTVFTRTGNDLTASIAGTSDQLVVKDWYLGTAYQVEQFAYANGTVLSNTQVANLVTAMAAFDQPTAAASSSMMRSTQFHATDLAAYGAMT